MADISTCPPLIPSSITTAYSKITKYIHTTPLLTSQSLDAIASSHDPTIFLSDDPPPFQGNQSGDANRDVGPVPKFKLHFKCENFQKIGAFKARGAFHAVSRLVEEMGIEEVRRRGVVTHSSGKSVLVCSSARTFHHMCMFVAGSCDH
jgi:threonine dehydratase